MTTVADPAARKNGRNRLLVTALDHWTLIVLFLLLFAFLVSAPGFYTKTNWIAVSTYATGLIAVAVGQSLVIISGGIDLSVGGIMALSGIAGGLTMRALTGHVPVLLTIIIGFAAGILVGVIVGLVNGLLSTKAGLSPFIVTLGMLGVTTGLAKVINDGHDVYDIPGELAIWGSTLWFGWLSPLVVISLIPALYFAVAMAKTRFGLRTYAIGSNADATRRIGINVGRHLIKLYVICGGLAALCGMVLVARFGSALTSAGTGAELASIAAVVIGGASLYGGTGTIGGTLIGVAIMSSLVTGLVLSGVQPFWQTVVTGVVIIAAVYIDKLRDRVMLREELRRKLVTPQMDVPAYADLPRLGDGTGPVSSWGCFGSDAALGSLNFADTESAMRGVRAIQSGEAFSLNWSLDLPDPPLFNRGAIQHHIVADGEGGFEDYYDRFFPQLSTQWDALGHIRHPEWGFYNGTAEDQVPPRGDQLSIHAIAKRGIATSFVLLDVARYFASTGRSLSPTEHVLIDADDLEQTLKWSGAELTPGSVVLLRFGWIEWYESMMRSGHGPQQIPAAPGLAKTDEIVEFLWDHRVAALAADNPAIEAMPFSLLQPETFLHFRLIPLMGFVLGELFDLQHLAARCAETGSYTGLFTAAPLTKPFGLGSSGNALAII